MTEAEIASKATPPVTRRRRTATPKASATDRGDAVVVAKDDRPHVHHVHFLEDGVTALDRVFLRGEEIKLTPKSMQYELAHDSEGNCVFAMDRIAQIRRFGKHLWDEGPWPFDPFDLQARLDNGEELTAEEQATLAEANKKRFKQQPLGASRANGR